MALELSPPIDRIRVLRDAAVRTDSAFVLYWMTAFRRTRDSFALDRAVHWANELKRPLLVFEPLRVGYEWASDRFHRFVIEGMADQRDRISMSKASYFPYVEPGPRDGSGLLEALMAQACIVITDDAPTFFLPRMRTTAAARSPVRMEAVDANGLHPIHSVEKTYRRAVDFRRHLQRTLGDRLTTAPDPDPLTHLQVEGTGVPDTILERWPVANLKALLREDGVARLPIDHEVTPVSYRGGANAASEVLDTFIENRLCRYTDDRRDLDDPATSGLSPYLHFGHIGAHRVLERIQRREGWSPQHLSGTANGSRSGWWGMSEEAEAFLDQLVTWRELGFNAAAREPDYREYDSLPGWARETLEAHAGDLREYRYSLEEFEEARTHDEIWNAAQRKLRTEGRIHNYLRMLWGKKIVHWTGSPRQAAEVMVHLNDRWAVDGRDPNSYSGIFWCLGRYDRPWGPERPIFGKVRYMTSQSTRRKLRLDGYLSRYGNQPGLGL